MKTVATALFIAALCCFMPSAQAEESLNARLASVSTSGDYQDPKLRDVAGVFREARFSSYELVSSKSVRLPARDTTLNMGAGISLTVSGDSGGLSISVSSGGRALISNTVRLSAGGRPVSYGVSGGGDRYLLILTVR